MAMSGGHLWLKSLWLWFASGALVLPNGGLGLQHEDPTRHVTRRFADHGCGGARPGPGTHPVPIPLHARTHARVSPQNSSLDLNNLAPRRPD